MVNSLIYFISGFYIFLIILSWFKSILFTCISYTDFLLLIIIIESKIFPFIVLFVFFFSFVFFYESITCHYIQYKLQTVLQKLFIWIVISDSSKYSSEGKFTILSENVAFFSKMLVEKLYNGMFVVDPENLLVFVVEQIAVVRSLSDADLISDSCRLLQHLMKSLVSGRRWRQGSISTRPQSLSYTRAWTGQCCTSCPVPGRPQLRKSLSSGPSMCCSSIGISSWPPTMPASTLSAACCTAFCSSAQEGQPISMLVLSQADKQQEIFTKSI